jgi:hypothetical protein
MTRVLMRLKAAGYQDLLQVLSRADVSPIGTSTGTCHESIAHARTWIMPQIIR